MFNIIHNRIVNLEMNKIHNKKNIVFDYYHILEQTICFYLLHTH